MPDARVVYSRIQPQDCAGLTINDAADYVGVGRSTMYTLLANGVVKSVKIRGRTIVLRASIDQYLKSLSA